MTFRMPEKQYKLWKQLRRDMLYLKPYNEFMQQFSDPAKVELLYNRMQSDKLLTKGWEFFKENFFSESVTPDQPRYQGTRHYAKPDKDSTKENIALERKFGDVYGDKNLWTRYAYLNSDEALKDMIVANENKVDPYVLAGTLSAEGLVDQLHGMTAVDPYFSINDVYEDHKRLERPMTGTQWFGLDDFYGRYEEFKQKGLTTLQENKDFVPYGDYIQETGTTTKPADFYHPQAGINAVSSYLKNIENIVDQYGVRATPEEREFLIHVGYNYGEGGLSSYLKKYKTAKEVISKIKEERPAVFKNAQKRVIVSKELRQSKSFDPFVRDDKTGT